MGQRYDQGRVDILASLGARSIRVSPVFAADGCVSNSPMQKSVKGILLAHKAAWDQIAAFPGYGKQMRGIFQQDRELYASTHAASDDDDGSGAGFSGVAGKSVGVGQAKEGPALNASQVKFLR